MQWCENVYRNSGNLLTRLKTTYFVDGYVSRNTEVVQHGGNISKNKHVSKYTPLYPYTHIHTCVHTHTHTPHTHGRAHTHTHTHRRVRAHTHTHTHTHKHTHNMYMYIHTYVTNVHTVSPQATVSPEKKLKILQSVTYSSDHLEIYAYIGIRTYITFRS